MKRLWQGAAAFLLVLNLNSTIPLAHGQGTAFTYQGQLQNNGSPATGSYDFRFRLAADAQGNNYVGSSVLTNGLAVAGGLFTITLDFGSVFTGSNYWLEVDVRTNGAASYTSLSPLQAVTPAPYAVFADTAGELSGTISSANLSGPYSAPVSFSNDANSFSGNGGGLTALNASELDIGTIPDARLATNVARTSQVWLLGGNAGANPTKGVFLGTTDNQPLELRVNGTRALRLEPNTNGAPNMVSGASVNFVSPGTVGATIAGGGVVDYFGYSYTNQVTGYFGTVSGGTANTASGNSSTVSGGTANTASGGSATVSGGFYNTASGYSSFAAGNGAQALHDSTFVWSDGSSLLPFSSTAPNQFLIGASGGVGIGMNAPQGLLHVQGNRTGGFGSSVMFAENLSTAAIAAPALRVVGWGNCPEGVLSVSGNGTGLIAQFGNYYRFVADIQTNGTIDAMAFNTTSDRNAKENFVSVDPMAILDKVTALPVSEWNYKMAGGIRHIGPMAQDFQAAFGVGQDDKHIATVDEEGVALAAIQGLNQKLNDKDAEIETLKVKAAKVDSLEKQNDSLAQRLSELEATVRLLAAQK